MSDYNHNKLEPDTEKFSAACNECGTVHKESFDNKPCSCGGVFHVDSARCLKWAVDIHSTMWAKNAPAVEQ